MVAAFYVLVLVLGILSMGFQLLGSRLLNPHFGSSIIVWGFLISTFLAAFSIGSMLGGWISSRDSIRQFRLQVAAAILAIASFAFTAVLGNPLLDGIDAKLQDETLGNNAGLLISCLSLFFVPVTMLSTFGPQFVQFLSGRGTPPGAASGVVYGVSTVGNIAGVMLTTFLFIPRIKVSNLLHLWTAVALFSLTVVIFIIRRPAPAMAKT